MTENRLSIGSSPLSKRLITRSGYPQDPNQRLPSFRNSLTKTSIIFQVAPNLTKSQPTTRSSSKLDNRSDGKEKKQIQPRNTNARLTKVSKSSRYKMAKKLVQLESTVFKGFPARSSSIRTRSTTSRNHEKEQTNSNSFPSLPHQAPSLNLKSEVDEQIEDDLLDDSFIDDSEDLLGKMEYVPQGWEPVQESESCSSSQTEENVKELPFLRDNKESLVFFQLPKFFRTNVSKKIGKLRVWKSGKTEIICPTTGETFDAILADKDFLSPQSVPTHDKIGPLTVPSIAKELVAYQNNTLTMLGGIQLQDMAIIVPRVPPLKECFPKTTPAKRKGRR